MPHPSTATPPGHELWWRGLFCRCRVCRRDRVQQCCTQCCAHPTSTESSTVPYGGLIQCLSSSVGDHAAGGFQEGFVKVVADVPADAQASEAVDQVFVRSTTHRRVPSRIREVLPLRAMTGLMPCFQSSRRTTAGAGDVVGRSCRGCRGCVEQGQQMGDVVAVAPGQGDGERRAADVGDDVVLRAGPGTVDRARPGFGPPRRAWRCEPSITARDQPSFRAWCSSVRSTWCSRSQTLASCVERQVRLSFLGR